MKSIIPKGQQQLLQGDDRAGAGKRKRKDDSDVESNNGTAPKIAKDRSKILLDEYIGVVGELMYPKTQFGPCLNSPEEVRLPVNKITTLGYLLNPLRKRTVLEKWNPLEIATFEGALTLYGKNFNQVQKLVKTKSVKEIIEFYYEWKKSKHYKEWKQAYVPDERDTPTVLVDG